MPCSQSHHDRRLDQLLPFHPDNRNDEYRASGGSRSTSPTAVRICGRDGGCNGERRSRSEVRSARYSPHRGAVHSEQSHLSHPVEDRQRYPLEMKPDWGEGVEVTVVVVYEVKAPQECRAMVPEMPPPEGVVENKTPSARRRGSGSCTCCSNPTRFRSTWERCGTSRGRWNADVTTAVAAAVVRLRAMRRAFDSARLSDRDYGKTPQQR